MSPPLDVMGPDGHPVPSQGTLTPVDFDPFAPPPTTGTLTPVDFDPFDVSQSWPHAIANAAAGAVVQGTGAAIAGAGRAADEGALNYLKESLARVNAGSGHEEVRAKARAALEEKIAEAGGAVPNKPRPPGMLERTGTSLEQTAQQQFPVDPTKEGHVINITRSVAGLAPVLGAAAVTAAVPEMLVPEATEAAAGAGAFTLQAARSAAVKAATDAAKSFWGKVGGITGAAATIYPQSYESTYQEAKQKGATEEQAHAAASKDAAIQTALTSVPVGRLLEKVPEPLRDGFIKTLTNVGMHGIEFGSITAASQFADNYVAQQSFDPDRKLTDGVFDSTLEGTLTGMVVPATAAGAKALWRAAKSAQPPASGAAPGSEPPAPGAPPSTEPPTPGMAAGPKPPASGAAPGPKPPAPGAPPSAQPPTPGMAAGPKPPASGFKAPRSVADIMATEGVDATAAKLIQEREVDALRVAGVPPPAEALAPPPQKPKRAPEASAVTPTTPEAPADVKAQIEAVADPKNPKDTAFIAAGTPMPPDVPKNIIEVKKPEGTLLTTDPGKAHAFQETQALTDAHLASLLGYPETKEEAIASGAPAVVQAVDPAGHAVTEMLASPAGIPAAEAVAEEHKPPGGDVRVVSPEQGQKERMEGRPAPEPTSEPTAPSGTPRASKSLNDWARELADAERRGDSAAVMAVIKRMHDEREKAMREAGWTGGKDEGPPPQTSEQPAAPPPPAPEPSRPGAMLADLDARGAPDAEYRSALSSGSKEPLKRGETWRDRLVAWVKHAEGKAPEPTGAFWWDRHLTPYGRELVAKAAGLPVKRSKGIAWQYVDGTDRAKLWAARGAAEEKIAPAPKPAAPRPTPEPRSAFIEAANYLAELRAQAEAQGRVVDARLLDKIRQQEQIVKDLQPKPEQPQTPEPAAAPPPKAPEPTAPASKPRAPVDDWAQEVADAFRRGGAQEAAAVFKRIHDERKLTGAVSAVFRDKAQKAMREAGWTGGKDEGPPPKTSEATAAPAPAASTIDPDRRIANAVGLLIDGGQKITATDIQRLGDQAYGGTLGTGGYSRDRLYDAVELGVNRYIADRAEMFAPTGDLEDAKLKAKALADIKAKLPTQSVRAGEKDTHQQFSTPPDYAFAAAWAADLRPTDSVLEPSAGTGGLAVHALTAGARQVFGNELSEKRQSMLRQLGLTRVFGENAEQIHNILPDDVKPSVVIMNPPFSAAPTRMPGKKLIEIGAMHIDQALERLQPGGRLVAIVGKGMAMDAPAFRDWWKRISDQYDVRANIGVAGSIYGKYGTTFPTRLLVIDKEAPARRPVIGGEVATAGELLDAVAPIRSDRTRSAGKPVAGEPGGAAVSAPSAGGRRPKQPVPSATGDVGLGPRDTNSPTGSESSEPSGGRDDNRPVAEPRTRPGGELSGLAVEKPKPQSGGATERPAGEVAPGEQPMGGVEGGAGGGVRKDGSGELNDPGVTPVPPEVVTTEAAVTDPANQQLTEAVYETYRPQRINIKGAKAHPGALVQSAAMASVMPPEPKYRPAIPQKLIASGGLSDAQLEAVTYAGNAHAQMLPKTATLPERRRGFFIGDGTGVGKGREVAGIILDNFLQGRTKAVWISEKGRLIKDAQRDWGGLGQKPDDLLDHSKVKAGEPIKATRGILFSTYDTLRSAEQTKVEGEKVRGKTRLSQIVDWLGKDFDGVIAFDEAHNMGNAVDEKGERGVKKASAKALAGVELQQALPNARVVYVSATGATEVSNLSYADRLGLWGAGTAFADRNTFLKSISASGIAGMELVARDMKALGHYISRNLSYDGVEYDRVQHDLNSDQRLIYDDLARGWLSVLANFQQALIVIGAEKNGAAKSAASSAFWGAHQRFFNQIITSMQMPSVLRRAESDIKAGRQVVMQLVNTNEAAQKRAIEKRKAEGDETLEDLDMTPRDQLMQLVRGSFPVQQFEDYVDPEGNIRQRPVYDVAGNPVINKKAVAMREALLDKLGSLRVPDGPLEILLNHFGADKVAEVTGRGERVIRKPDDKGVMRTVLEKRPGGSNVAETVAFQAGKKPVLVFSEAGGTGASYHADLNSGSADKRRSHYLLQAGWRADKAVQGFGRTHRTNQASAPFFHLVTTDIEGQKRFISSIARRLAQLGALTKGERRTGDQGMFGLRDNLESGEARTALRQFVADVAANKVPDLELRDLEKAMGLEMVDKKTGQLKPPEMTQFLNRLLSLTVGDQNKVFTAFSERLDDTIDRAATAGTLDTGVETYKADRLNKVSDQVVYEDKESGAETRHVKLLAEHRNYPMAFDKAVATHVVGAGGKFIQSKNTGRLFIARNATAFTNKDGQIIDQTRLISPNDYQYIPSHRLEDHTRWQAVTDHDQARRLWDDQVAKTPEYRSSDLHLITGAVLPIWDRLGGSAKIYRLQTDGGERMLGRVVPNEMIDATLESLGAEKQKINLSNAEIAKRVMAGSTATLANGWRIKRSRVAGENRLEVVGPNYTDGDALRGAGLFSERIDWNTRFFIPTDDRAAGAIEAITRRAPITSLAGGNDDEGPQFSRPVPLYSAVSRAVDGLKQARGTGEQFLAQITKTPGVKPEEVKWLGLDTWLRGQKSVTREQVADYVRANALDVREVTKGGPTMEALRADHDAAQARLLPAFDAISDALRRTGYRAEVNGGKLWADELGLGLRSGDIRPDQLPDTPGLRAAAEHYVEIERAASTATAAYDAARTARAGGSTRHLTKYAAYQLPGGENYRELLITLPEKAGGERGPQGWGDTAGGTADTVNYRTGHWEEPNILAHIRFADRVGADGKKVLLVEEGQSDWHQAGRRKGYQDPDVLEERRAEQRRVVLEAQEALRNAKLRHEDARNAIDAIRGPDFEERYQADRKAQNAAFDDMEINWRRIPAGPEREAFRNEAKARYENLANDFYKKYKALSDAEYREVTLRNEVGLATQKLRHAERDLEMVRHHKDAVLNAPFKTSWPALVMKRMLQYAVDNGYDRIAWSPGDVHAERYDLAKHVRDLYHWKEPGGDIALSAYGHKGEPIIDYHRVAPDKLEDVVGKEVAERILNGEGHEPGPHDDHNAPGTKIIDGEGLRVGGEGMKGFYDDILPKETNKIVGKFGAKVGRSDVRISAVPHFPDDEGNDPEMEAWLESREPGKTQSVHSVDITPQLRDAVSTQGLPLFERGAGGAPTTEALQAIADAAQRIVGPHVRVELHDGDGLRVTHQDGRVERVDGLTMGRLIRAAMSPRPKWTLNHEAIHALRNLGVFTPAEWNTLQADARREGWIKQYRVEERYPDLSPELQMEEAIADRFADRVAQMPAPGTTLARAWAKFNAFLARLRNALAGRGFRTAEDVFGRVAAGDVGQREPGSGMAERGPRSVGESQSRMENWHAGEPQFAKLPASAQKPLSLKPDPAWKRAVDEIRTVLSPTSRGSAAKRQEYAHREFGARLAQASQIAAHRLEDARRLVSRYSPGEQNEQNHKLETGRRLGNPKLDAAAKALRESQAEWLQKLQSLGYLTDTIDNYMGHIYSNYREWKAGQIGTLTPAQVDARNRMLAAMKRPIRGPGEFLKQRTFDTLQDAMVAGLEPVTHNWIDMQLLKLRSMQRFYEGTQYAEKMKKTGLAFWVPVTATREAEASGFKKLNDEIFQPRIRSDAEYGVREVGNWMAPGPAADVFNNAMAPGLMSKFPTIYGGLRSTANALNSLQLGLSGFHATFEALDSIHSQTALGLRQIARGSVGKGIRTIAGAYAAPVTTWRAGNQFIRAYLDPDKASPEMRKIVDAAIKGGVRIGYDKFYRSTEAGPFFHSLKDLANPQGAFREALAMVTPHPGEALPAQAWHILRGSFRVAGRLIDTSMEPLMGFVVPKLKAGVMANLARDFLEHNPMASEDAVAAAMTKAQDSVDNRMGELVYDNLFWHKTLKDIALLTTRSVGWNLGTLRELGGAVVDTAHQANRIAHFKAPELTDRMAYAIAMTVNTALIGSIMTYLATGQGPQSLMDLFYPPDGTTQPNGAKNRLSVPGYIKDVVDWTTAPLSTAGNKANPLISMAIELGSNKDYYGGIIYNSEKDNPFIAYADYLLNQTLPFSARATMRLKAQGASPLQQMLGFWGIQSAPQSIVNPAKGEMWNHRQMNIETRRREREQGRISLQ